MKEKILNLINKVRVKLSKILAPQFSETLFLKLGKPAMYVFAFVLFLAWLKTGLITYSFTAFLCLIVGVSYSLMEIVIKYDDEIRKSGAIIENVSMNKSKKVKGYSKTGEISKDTIFIDEKETTTVENVEINNKEKLLEIKNQLLYLNDNSYDNDEIEKGKRPKSKRF